MAFKDLNGQITIDEDAAQNDINNLFKILENLHYSRDKFKNINAQALEFEGQTGNSIVESSQELMDVIDASIANVEESINLIRATVEKYHNIDQSLKTTISTSI